MFCVDIKCGNCNRINIVRIKDGKHFCVNCDMTIALVYGIQLTLKNDSKDIRFYEC